MASPQTQPAIMIHGGAGRVVEDDGEERLEGCRRALARGYAVLANGGTALDAVEAAVTDLENNPSFNAGVGAPLNGAGEVELDASIMDGARLRAGAVAALQGLRNPVAVARRVLEDGRHVLLAGSGAQAFAYQSGFAPVRTQDLITPHQQQRWEAEHGTVGCVAVDTRGCCAAATSTGGLFNKLPGRVGDSAIIGAGTYADETGAVSCTGIGEDIIKVALAKTAIDFLHQGFEPAHAAGAALAVFRSRTRSEAGLIVVDRCARVGSAHNAQEMPHGHIGPSGESLSPD